MLMTSSERNLIKQLVKRDFEQKYKGSYLGKLWSLATPLLTLFIYSVVFGFILNVGGEQVNKLQFPIFLFAGLALHGALSEVLYMSCSKIASNQSYVKKIVFPLHVFSPIIVLSAFSNLLISFAIIVVYASFVSDISLTSLPMIALILLPYLMLLMGISWFIQAVGVFFKDINQIISMVVTALLFISPILIPMSKVPVEYQDLLYINPLTYPVTVLREVIFTGSAFNFVSYFSYLAISVFVFFLGFTVFQRLKRGFSDAI